MLSRQGKSQRKPSRSIVPLRLEQLEKRELLAAGLTLIHSGPVSDVSNAAVSLPNLPTINNGNNAGVLEVKKGTSATDLLPASFLDGGLSTRNVQTLSTLLSGVSTGDTTSMRVKNLTLSPTLTGSTPSSAGAKSSISAPTTPPSQAGASAGLPYPSNFGVTSTGSAMSVRHPYATPGNPSATGTPPPSVTPPTDSNAYIITPTDKIPNFGEHPTDVAVRSGNWSDPTIWSAGHLPGAGDVVNIGAGVTVTYDIVSTQQIDTVSILAGGTLQFRTDINTQLTVANLLVLQGGTLTVGTAQNPVSATVSAQIVFADTPLNLIQDPSQYGHGLIGLGKVSMAGSTRNTTFVKLASEAHAGDTTLTLAQAVTGWQVGDKLVLPDTHQLDWWERGLNNPKFVSQWETPTIAAISADGKTITLAARLQFNHLGSRDSNGKVEFLPDVGVLSRNVRVQSENARGTRGHVEFLNRADIDIRYVAFAGLGRTKSLVDGFPIDEYELDRDR